MFPIPWTRVQMDRIREFEGEISPLRKRRSWKVDDQEAAGSLSRRMPPRCPPGSRRRWGEAVKEVRSSEAVGCGQSGGGRDKATAHDGVHAAHPEDDGPGTRVVLADSGISSLIWS